MILRDEEMENAIIEKVTIGEYIQQLDPDVRKILYEAYGNNLEALPKEVLCLPMSEFLEQLLRLNTTAQKVILMRFGIKTGTPMSLEQVAAELDISRDRVRQLENIFLRRKSRPLKRKNNLID